MSTEFNLTRLGHFMRRQLYMNVSSMWIAIAAVIGVLLVISGIVAYGQPDTVMGLPRLMGLRNIYLLVFMLGGYIFTSKVFDEMHAQQKSYTFHSLPVSANEKLFGAWLITSPMYVLAFALLILLLSVFNSLVAGTIEALPQLFDKNFFGFIKVYLVTQAIFFLGATAFRGNNFLKTLLAVFILVLIVVGYTAGLGFLLFGGRNYHIGPDSELKGTAEFIVKDLIPFLFWFVLPVFLLVVSYFKLKERQV